MTKKDWKCKVALKQNNMIHDVPNVEAYLLNYF